MGWGWLLEMVRFFNFSNLSATSFGEHTKLGKFFFPGGNSDLFLGQSLILFNYKTAEQLKFLSVKY
jgi:hypothetical protein